MANYATLKAAIQAAIKQNGNNEITGNLLQAQLLSMVDSLGNGYIYKGIATPSTNPGVLDQKCFYIAFDSGIYANMGGTVFSENEIGVIKWDDRWRKEIINASSHGEVLAVKQQVTKITGGDINYFEKYLWRFGVYYDSVNYNTVSRKFVVVKCGLGDKFVFNFHGSSAWGFYVYFADANGTISYREILANTTITIAAMSGGRVPTEMRITTYPRPDQEITSELWDTFPVELIQNFVGLIPEIDERVDSLENAISNEDTIIPGGFSPTWIMGYLARDTGALMSYTGNYYYSQPFRLSKGSTVEFTATGQGISTIALYSDASGTNCFRVVNNDNDTRPHLYTITTEVDCFVRVCCNNKDSCVLNLRRAVTLYGDLSKLTHLRVAEWNWGLLNNGVLPFGVPDEQVDTAIANIKTLLISLNADILIATEFSEYINRSQTLNTYDTLLAQFFPFMYMGGNYMAVFSKVPFEVSSISSPDNRNMELGILTAYRGRVGFGVIHPRSAEGTAAEDARIADHQAVIDHFADFNLAIVGGDFNTYVDRELDVYRNNGWTLGNCGYFGNIDTYMPSERSWYIDNVVTKGVNINNFTKINDRAGVSDHYPVVADLSFWL